MEEKKLTIEQFKPRPREPFSMDPFEVSCLKNILYSHSYAFNDKDQIDDILCEYVNALNSYRIIKLETELTMLKNLPKTNC